MLAAALDLTLVLEVLGVIVLILAVIYFLRRA